ncbi:hypothetical protein L9F63_011392, partial [Diploptera punctata]
MDVSLAGLGRGWLSIIHLWCKSCEGESNSIMASEGDIDISEESYIPVVQALIGEFLKGTFVAGLKDDKIKKKA